MDFKCPACGAPCNPGEKFCQNCGTKLPVPEAPAEVMQEAPAAPVEAPAAPVYEAPAAPEAPVAPAAPAAPEAPAVPVYEAPAAPVPPAAPAYQAPAAPAYQAPAAPVPPVYQAPAAPNYPPQQNVPNYAPTGAPNYAPKAAPNYAPQNHAPVYAPQTGAPAYAAAPAAPKKKKTGLIIGLCAGAAVLIAAAILLYFFVLSPSGITLSAETATLSYLDTIELTAEVSPGSALNKSVTWTSSDDEIATVWEGSVTGWSAGTCEITATTSNGKSATCVVTVIVEPYSVWLSEYWVDMEIGDTLTLTADVYPEDATDKSVTWTTSDSSVATVSNGVVTAVGEGDCEITATTTNGVSESCSISVSAAEEPTDPTEPSVPNGIEDSAYDKFVVGEWKLVLYYDFDSGEDIPVENLGLSGKIVFNADHTARVTMNGESADYVWYFEEIDEYGDYCFWVENDGESLPFDYIVDDGDIWLYLDETTLTYQK